MAQINMEIEPFPVPDKVYLVGKPGLRQDGPLNKREIPLSDLDRTILNELVDEFRSTVFRKAGMKYE